MADRFADATSVRLRMGLGSFTADQTAQATYLLSAAAAAIAGTIGKTDEWIEEQAAAEPVPPVLRITSIEMVARVMLNPGGVRSRQETLGSHSRGETFSDAAAALEMTDREERRVRRAVNGSGIGGASLGSTVLEQIGDALGAGSARVAGITAAPEAKT